MFCGIQLLTVCNAISFFLSFVKKKSGNWWAVRGCLLASTEIRHQAGSAALRRRVKEWWISWEATRQLTKLFCVYAALPFLASDQKAPKWWMILAGCIASFAIICYAARDDAEEDLLEAKQPSKTFKGFLDPVSGFFSTSLMSLSFPPSVVAEEHEIMQNCCSYSPAGWPLSARSPLFIRFNEESLMTRRDCYSCLNSGHDLEAAYHKIVHSANSKSSECLF